MFMVIDIENITLGRINNKFGKSRSGRLFLTKEYRDFKAILTMTCRKIQVPPPYHVVIEFTGQSDIDAHIKPILDALETAGVLDNDKNVYQLSVLKRKAQAKETRLTVAVETIK